MCTTHALQLQGADHVGGQLLGVGQGHAHHPVCLCAPTGPVLKIGNCEHYYGLQMIYFIYKYNSIILSLSIYFTPGFICLLN